MKMFCTAGPINPEFHYFIPHRLNRADLHRLITSKEYFVLHAPRQSGKTTGILEYCCELTLGGLYNALYVNVEAAQASRENIQEGLLIILNELLSAVQNQWPHERKIIEFLKERLDAGFAAINLSAFQNALTYLAQGTEKPVVLFIDEIDSLIGDTLLAVLRQTRSGFNNRPKSFPHALCLIGLRDIRDYHNFFNIKSESLVLENFTLDDIQELYEQHTQETGQKFTPEAVEYVFYLTAGQPWLVNALAYQACYRDVKDALQTITKEDIDRAKEALIKRRDTHIDSLADKLQEVRVRPIIETILNRRNKPCSYQT